MTDKKFMGHNVHTFNARGGIITCIKHIKDGIVAYGTDSGYVNIWNKQLTNTFEVSNDSVNCIEVLNSELIVGCENGSIKKINLETGEMETISNHSCYVSSLYIHNGIASASRSGTVKFLNNSVHCNIAVNDIVIHKNKVFCCLDNGEIIVYDIGTSKTYTLKEHKDSVLCATIFNDNLVTGSADKTLCIHGHTTLSGHTGWVTGITILNNKLISIGTDGKMCIWDGIHPTIIPTGQSILRGIDTYPGGVITCSEDSIIKIWT
jgi:hypothetical protein